MQNRSRSRRLSERAKAAVAAHLLAGATCRETAKEVGVGLGTVGEMSVKIAAQVIEEKRKRIGDLLLEMVQEIVSANIKLARLLGDPDYAKHQRASDLAILGGTLLDKSFLVLAAAERAQLGNPDGGFGSLALPRESATDLQTPTSEDPHRGPDEGGGDPE